MHPVVVEVEGGQLGVRGRRGVCGHRGARGESLVCAVEKDVANEVEVREIGNWGVEPWSRLAPLLPPPGLAAVECMCQFEFVWRACVASVGEGSPILGRAGTKGTVCGASAGQGDGVME